MKKHGMGTLRSNGKRGAALLLCVLLCAATVFGAAPAALATGEESAVTDEASSAGEIESSQAAPVESVPEAAPPANNAQAPAQGVETGDPVIRTVDFSSDGANLILSIAGSAYYDGSRSFSITDSAGAVKNYSLVIQDSDVQCWGENWSAVAGLSVSGFTRDGENYSATLTIPISSISSDGDFTVSLLGVSKTAQELGVTPVEKPDPAAAYTYKTGAETGVLGFNISSDSDYLYLEYLGDLAGTNSTDFKFSIHMLNGDTVEYTLNRGTLNRGGPIWGNAPVEEFTCENEPWPSTVFTGTAKIPLKGFLAKVFDFECGDVTVSAKEIGLLAELGDGPIIWGGIAPPKANTSGKIVVDGAAEDWEAITPLTPSDTSSFDSSFKVDTWKAVADENGTVYLCFEGEANRYSAARCEDLQVAIAQYDSIKIYSLGELAKVSGAEFKVNDVTSDRNDAMVVELSLPNNFFTDPDFVLTFCGVDLRSSDLPVIDGKDEETGDSKYEGIVIDGKFKDWNAVTKYDANDPNGQLSKTGMVFDGDWIYIYLEETPGEGDKTSGDAAVAGSHATGQYTIKTDLGYDYIFRLHKSDDGTGSISGLAAEGAEVKHFGTKWEIAIPASNIEHYLNTISFGTYLDEPSVKDVANLNGKGSGGSFNGIVFDGQYLDWAYYPHTTIQYDTNGTQGDVADGFGALYSEGSTLLGHFETQHPDHLQVDGANSFAHAITYWFGDKEFNPRLVTIDENGVIDYMWTEDRMKSLAPSATPYHFYIVNQNGNQDAKTLDDLLKNNDAEESNTLLQRLFGEAYITIDPAGVKNESEVKFDLDVVAKHFGCDAGDFKQISAQYGRIGQEWVTIAGTSSGAWLGVALCLLITFGGGWFLKKRKGAAAAK